MNSRKFDKWMEFAIQEARIAQDIGEVPVGAVLVYENQIIAKSHNKTIKNFDPTSHAEINVIRQAAKKIGNYRLIGTSLYVTLEPCSMCYGAIIQARIENLVFGAFDNKTGVCGSCENFHVSLCFNHKPNIVGGILEKDCSKLLSDFFKHKRN